MLVAFRVALLASLCFTQAFAAPSVSFITENGNDSPYDLNPLPLIPTPEEARQNLAFKDQILAQKFKYARKASDGTLAVPMNPRVVAEFEPMQGALVRYPLGVPLPFIKDLSEHVKVFTLVASQTVKATATTSFQSAGVNLANVEFIIAPTDSYWTRDYGAWWVTMGEDSSQDSSIAIVDFTYDRYRPQDNLVNQAIAEHFKVPYYFSGITHTGGNFMTTGTILAASTTLVYSTNNGNTSFVTSTMEDFYGIRNYFVTPDPTFTYIEHIDTWAKFLTVDTVLVRRVSSLDRSYDATEAAAAAFATLQVQVGSSRRSVRVLRLDIENSNTDPYLNSYIINNRVYVPILKSEDDEKDARALQTYRESLPYGYEVIGVPPVSGALWLNTDALHCRVNSIPKF